MKKVKTSELISDCISYFKEEKLNVVVLNRQVGHLRLSYNDGHTADYWPSKGTFRYKNKSTRNTLKEDVVEYIKSGYDGLEEKINGDFKTNRHKAAKVRNLQLTYNQQASRRDIGKVVSDYVKPRRDYSDSGHLIYRFNIQHYFISIWADSGDIIIKSYKSGEAYSWNQLSGKRIKNLLLEAKRQTIETCNMVCIARTVEKQFDNKLKIEFEQSELSSKWHKERAKHDHLVVYTDGAAINWHKNGRSGWGAVIKSKDGMVAFSGIDRGSSYKMELLAVVNALEKIENAHNIVLFVDNNRIVRGINQWIEKWTKNGWKTSEGKNVRYRALWERVIELKKKHFITCFHVKAHAGNELNELADYLAVNARMGNVDTVHKICPILSTQTCRYCGNEFTVIDSLPETKHGFCSPKCKKEMTYETNTTFIIDPVQPR